jgi:hypothetical protein
MNLLPCRLAPEKQPRQENNEAPAHQVRGFIKFTLLGN